MIASPLEFRPHPLGHVFEDSTLTVFFGAKISEKEAAARAFPDYRLLGVRQTHSDVVIESPYEEPGPEADAHFTQKRKLAISIRTADCIPVMIFDPESSTVAAIHAGWRGVENEIIRKVGAKLGSRGVSLNKARAWIGPHIGSRSFEVGRDVATKLEARFEAVRGYSNESTSLLPHSEAEKSFVDLLLIARAQLSSIGIDRDRTLALEIDTFQSQQHESFRRDREKALRQLSFIALK